MIYTFYGNDTKRSSDAAQKLIAGLQKRKPDASYFKMTELSFDVAQAEEWVKSQGLFSQNYIVYFDGVLRNAEAKPFVISILKEMKVSGSIFIIHEGKIDASTFKKIETLSEKVQEYALDESTFTKTEKLAQKGEKIDFFEYSDVLGGGDKKKIWTLYVDAVKKGVPAEELHGIYFWQVKTMLLASKTSTPLESGLNPFVYRKNKDYARGYGIEKLEKMMTDLVEMFHRAHRGELDFFVALERWILAL